LIMDENLFMAMLTRCTTGTFTIKDLRKTISVAHGEKGETIRPLLITDEGKFLLMINPHQGDTIVGKGNIKTAMFALNLDTADLNVVTVTKKELCNPIDWKTLSNEIDLLKQFKGTPEFLQLITFRMLEDECTIITQYCNGGSLIQAILSKALSFPETVQIALDLSHGLVKIHSLNLIHRDLTPNNVLLVKKPNELTRGVIADFGQICEQTDLAQKKKLVLFPLWIAPEKAKLIFTHEEGSPAWQAMTTQKEDIWSLGLIFFLLFRGGVPHFQQKTSPNEDLFALMERLSSLTQEAFSKEIRASPLPPFCIPLIECMLQIDPQKRLDAQTIHAELCMIKKLMQSA